MSDEAVMADRERSLADKVGKAHDDPTRAAEELITLGLFVFYKWDRIYHREQSQPGPLNPAILSSIDASFTANEIRALKRTAQEALHNHHQTRTARSWWSGVAQSAVGSLF